jgi:hypothetical protein
VSVGVARREEKLLRGRLLTVVSCSNALVLARWWFNRLDPSHTPISPMAVSALI